MKTEKILNVSLLKSIKNNFGEFVYNNRKRKRMLVNERTFVFTVEAKVGLLLLLLPAH